MKSIEQIKESNAKVLAAFDEQLAIRQQLVEEMKDMNRKAIDLITAIRSAKVS
jgi:hypothetical protein